MESMNYAIAFGAARSAIAFGLWLGMLVIAINQVALVFISINLSLIFFSYLRKFKEF